MAGTVKGALITALALLIALPAPAQAKVFNPVSFTLDNGMEVVVVPNHRAPVVHHMLWFKVGAADEEPGKSGLAHYLEHLLFKGTPSMAAGAYSKVIAAAGGHDNAFTSNDYTGYYATVPAEFLPKLMAMEADRMQNLALTDEAARPELSVVLAERRQRTDDDPQGRFQEKMMAAVYGGHAYGRPVIGWRKEVEKMNFRTAAEFYHRWYHPNNAVLVISGDVTPERVKELAAETYDLVPSQELPPRFDPDAGLKPRQKPGSVTVKDPDVQQPVLQRIYVAPSYRTAHEREAYALEVLAEILDGGEVGRLYRSLAVRQKLAVGTGADYHPDARGPGQFTFGVSLRPGANPSKVAAALDSLLRDVVQKGVTPEETAQAVKRLTRQAIFARDHLTAPGRSFGQTLATGGTIKDVENWPEHIESVTAEDINEAARKLFGGKDYVTGFLLPTGGKRGAKPAAVKPPQEEIR